MSKEVEKSTTQNVIEIQNLSKHYGGNVAVDNISFTVKKGEILGFLGPNGAGKTTTMNILTGYISYTSGTVKVDGYDILENANDAKKKIGYLPENPPLYMDMTVLEYLGFVYDLKKVSEDKKQHIAEVMKLVDVENVKGRLIKNLSKGYKQRIGLAQALLGNPEVLVLDEPTVGLDPKQIIEIRNVIRQLGKNRTIILSTHILPEVSAICDRVIIINKGRIAALDTTDNLTSGISGNGRYALRVAADEYQIKGAFADIKGIKYLEALGSKEKGTMDFLIESDPAVDVRYEIFSALAAKGYTMLMIKPMELTLEEIFIKVTNDGYVPEQSVKQMEDEPSPTVKNEEQDAAAKQEEETTPTAEASGSKDMALGQEPESQEKESAE